MTKELINGAQWLDTDGNPIHAHGGHLLAYGGWYYWYGEDRRENYYVSCYRSRDLVDWEFRRHVLTTDSRAERSRVHADLSLTQKPDAGEVQSALYVGNEKYRKVNVERPKVLYCAETGKFVMWAHWENGLNYKDARCCVATCDTPDGDFVYHGSFNPFGNMSRDCTLFLDDDGRAYFISAARDNADLNVYRLSRDFLNTDKLVNVLWQSEFREAPAVFKRGDRYYMLSSGTTGWKPNQGKFATARALDGEWSLLENYADDTNYASQPSFVLPSDSGFLYFGDRWGGRGDLYFTSSYVVLPIDFDGEKLILNWRDSGLKV